MFCRNLKKKKTKISKKIAKGDQKLNVVTSGEECRDDQTNVATSAEMRKIEKLNVAT